MLLYQLLLGGQQEVNDYLLPEETPKRGAEDEETTAGAVLIAPLRSAILKLIGLDENGKCTVLEEDADLSFCGFDDGT